MISLRCFLFALHLLTSYRWKVVLDLLIDTCSTYHVCVESKRLSSFVSFWASFQKWLECNMRIVFLCGRKYSVFRLSNMNNIVRRCGFLKWQMGVLILGQISFFTKVGLRHLQADTRLEDRVRVNFKCYYTQSLICAE